MHERKIVRVILILAVGLIFLFPSCDKPNTEKYKIPKFDGFSVHFLDVGEGNSTFVHFPDGKNMLFDCGSDLENNYETVKSTLSDYGVTDIDYLILSHPDGEHIGNAVKVIEDFKVKTVYIPNVLDREYYPEFRSAYNLLSNKNVIISKAYESVLGEDYSLVFLSPDLKGDLYAEFNGATIPTENQLNNISPIIYLTYRGVRFLLTADATSNAESKIVDDYKSSISKVWCDKQKIDFDLCDVDFYLVAGHGTEKSNSSKLLSLIKPKNAVISVGGNNLYGYPKSSVLSSLISINSDINIYRTDYYGSISVLVDNSGKYQVKVEANV